MGRGYGSRGMLRHPGDAPRYREPLRAGTRAAEGAAGPREARPAPHLPGITGPQLPSRTADSKVSGAARRAPSPDARRSATRSARAPCSLSAPGGSIPGSPCSSPGARGALPALPARPGAAGAVPQVREAGRGRAGRRGGQWAPVGGAGPGVKRAGIHERRAKLGRGGRGSRTGCAAVRPGMPAGRRAPRGSGGQRGPRR